MGKNKVNKWFNDELLGIKETISKYQVAKFENTGGTWADYKSIRNLHKVWVENEECQYIDNYVINAKDEKEANVEGDK